MIRKIKNTIKNEKGIIFLPIAIGIFAGASLVGAIVAWFSGDSFTSGVVRGIGTILYVMSYQLAIFSASLFGGCISFLDKSITKDPNFLIGWDMTRNLANMAIVLGLVIVGIATALRLENYAAKKILPKLIIIALLINFSPLLCGVIIDASNILYRNIEPTPITESSAVAIVNSIHYAADGNGPDVAGSSYRLPDGCENGYLNCDKFKEDAKGLAAAMAQFILMYIMVALTFFYVFFIIIQRFLFLGIYFIMSPLAFVCWIFPATNKYWKSWWEGLVQWAFVGTATTFFIILANKMLASSETLDNINLFVILIFYYISLKFAKKYSGNVGSMAFGLAGAGVGYAMGAVAKGSNVGGNVLDRLSGGRLSAAGRNIKDKATGFGERIGAIKQGTTETNRAERLKEPMSRLEKIPDTTEGNQKLAEIAEQRGNTGLKAADKAAAATLLAKRNKFDTIDATKRDSVAAHATAFGVEKSAFTKGSPGLMTAAKSDEEAMDYMKNKEADSYLASAAAAGTPMSRKDALTAADTRIKTLTPANLEHEIKQAHGDIKQQRTMQNALNLSDLTDREVTIRAQEDRQKYLASIGKTPVQIAEQMKGWKPGDGVMATTKQTLSKERIQKKIAKLDTPGITSAPNELLKSLEFGENVGYQTLSRSLPRLSADKLASVKQSLPGLQSRVSSLSGLPVGATKPQINARIASLSASTNPADRELAKKIEQIANNYFEIKKA